MGDSDDSDDDIPTQQSGDKKSRLRRKGALEDSSSEGDELFADDDDDDEEEGIEGGGEETKAQGTKFSPERMGEALKSLKSWLRPTPPASCEKWSEIDSLDIEISQVADLMTFIDRTVALSLECKCLITHAAMKTCQLRDAKAVQALFKRPKGTDKTKPYLAQYISGIWLSESLSDLDRCTSPTAEDMEVVFLTAVMRFVASSFVIDSAKKLDVLKDKHNLDWKESCSKVLKSGSKFTMNGLVASATRARDFVGQVSNGTYVPPDKTNKGNQGQAGDTTNKSGPIDSDGKRMEDLLKQRREERKRKMRQQGRALAGVSAAPSGNMGPSSAATAAPHPSHSWQPRSAPQRDASGSSWNSASQNKYTHEPAPPPAPMQAPTHTSEPQRRSSASTMPASNNGVGGDGGAGSWASTRKEDGGPNEPSDQSHSRHNSTGGGSSWGGSNSGSGWGDNSSGWNSSNRQPRATNPGDRHEPHHNNTAHDTDPPVDSPFSGRRSSWNDDTDRNQNSRGGYGSYSRDEPGPRGAINIADRETRSTREAIPINDEPRNNAPSWSRIATQDNPSFVRSDSRRQDDVSSSRAARDNQTDDRGSFSNRRSDYDDRHSDYDSGRRSDYSSRDSGYDRRNSGYDKGYDRRDSDYDDRNTGHDRHNSGYDNRSYSGYDSRNTDYDSRHSDYSENKSRSYSDRAPADPPSNNDNNSGDWGNRDMRSDDNGRRGRTSNQPKRQSDVAGNDYDRKRTRHDYDNSQPPPGGMGRGLQRTRPAWLDNQDQQERANQDFGRNRDDTARNDPMTNQHQGPPPNPPARNDGGGSGSGGGSSSNSNRHQDQQQQWNSEPNNSRGAGRGRGRNQTLPAWMTRSGGNDGPSRADELPPPSRNRDDRPPDVVERNNGPTGLAPQHFAADDGGGRGRGRGRGRTLPAWMTQQRD